VDDNSGLTPPDPEQEGIRIIGPEEAAEAVERGDVAQRRADHEPKYGDRPREAEAQPKGPRPTLRFPRPDSPEAVELEGMERPRVKPPTSPPEEPERRSLFSVQHDPPDVPLDQDAEDEPAQPAGEGEGGDEPVRLPHWTEPATGEIPRVLVPESEADDDSAWQAFADGGPRWRDDSKDYDERDDIAALVDDDPKMGALDEDAPGEHELLSFDDLDPSPARPPGRGPVPARKVGATSGPRRSGLAPDPTSMGTPPGTPPGPRSRGPARGPVRAGGPPTGGDRDMGLAVGVGVGLGAAAIVALFISPGAMMAVVSLVVLVGAAEFFTTTRRAGYMPAHLLGIVACVALPLATFWKGTLGYPVVLGLTTMCAFLWYIVGAGEERPTMNMGVTALGIMWIGMLASFAGLLLGAPDGASLMLSVLVVAVAHDVGAFFVGRSMGRAPLTAISPGKTVEGLFGGIVAAVVVALLVVGVGKIGPFGDSIGRAFALGLVVGVATAIGDLCESVVKRDLGVKDMGNVLPGHGGVLDRMDGILFALPAAWYLYLVLITG
jgi:phosphatidate cytidylyltransferase